MAKKELEFYVAGGEPYRTNKYIVRKTRNDRNLAVATHPATKKRLYQFVSGE